MLTTSKRARTVLLTTVLIFSYAGIASATIVGIDFDDPGGSAPTNWNKLAGSASNLINESGAVTSIDVTWTSSFIGAQSINASTLPSHTPNLAGLDGFATVNSAITFSDLTPLATYQLWIFSLYDAIGVGLFGGADFDATVTGNGAPVVFSFSMHTEGDLVINGVTGSNAQPLVNFGDIVVASATGTLGITFSNALGGNPSGEFPIAGVAIESVAAIPEARAWLTLGVVAVGAIGIQAFRNRRGRIVCVSDGVAMLIV